MEWAKVSPLYCYVPQRGFVCPESSCGVTGLFSSPMDLQLHLESVHSYRFRARCGNCCLKFCNLDNTLLDHIYLCGGAKQMNAEVVLFLASVASGQGDAVPGAPVSLPLMAPFLVPGCEEAPSDEIKEEALGSQESESAGRASGTRLPALCPSLGSSPREQVRDFSAPLSNIGIPSAVARSRVSAEPSSSTSVTSGGLGRSSEAAQSTEGPQWLRVRDFAREQPIVCLPPASTSGIERARGDQRTETRNDRPSLDIALDRVESPDGRRNANPSVERGEDRRRTRRSRSPPAKRPRPCSPSPHQGRGVPSDNERRRGETPPRTRRRSRSLSPRRIRPGDVLEEERLMEIDERSRGRLPERSDTERVDTDRGAGRNGGGEGLVYDAPQLWRDERGSCGLCGEEGRLTARHFFEKHPRICPVCLGAFDNLEEHFRFHDKWIQKQFQGPSPIDTPVWFTEYPACRKCPPDEFTFWSWAALEDHYYNYHDDTRQWDRARPRGRGFRPFRGRGRGRGRSRGRGRGPGGHGFGHGDRPLWKNQF